MLTSEKLRVAALEASAKRGKWVAKRRVWRRWTAWFAWTIFLPVIGLAAVMAMLAGLAFWQYMGHDPAYVATQKWVQQEFGKFQTNNSNFSNSTNGSGNRPTLNRSENASLIPLTYEATPDLQLDRNLTIKPGPK